MGGAVCVEDVLSVLSRWQPHLLAGEHGLARPVNWAGAMRARLPAFEGFSGGEVAFCSLATLRALRAQVYELSLPVVVDQLAEIGVAAIVVMGLLGLTEGRTLSEDEAAALEAAKARADALDLPFIGLPVVSPNEVVGEVIAYLVARRQQSASFDSGETAYASTLRASLRAEALDSLLAGAYAGEAAMRLRASQLGYDLSRPHVVLWIDLVPGDAAALIPHDRSSRLAEALSVGLGAWATSGASHVAALLPAAPTVHENAGDDLGERLRTLLAREMEPHSWCAGLGEPAHTPAQVHRSATEARDAARLGRLALGTGHIARLADLGVYQLLVALRESGQLAPFVERTLAPLLDKTRTADDLLKTLDVFFDCNGNLSEAARRLHLHRNSLIYRLNNASAALGRSLDDADLRLALQIAIKGRDVLAW